MGRLSGKIAIVTGGASGIGEAIVRLFAREGAKVIIADVQADRGEALSAELGDLSKFCLTDVSSAPSVARMIQFSVAQFGALNILVNNAGILKDGAKIAEAPEADFDETIAVDLKGVWLGIKYAVPELLRAQGGSVVNISSIAGITGLKMQSAYGAAKGGVVQLTRHAAAEYAADGIRINCLCPGGIVTPLSYRRRPGMSESEVKAQFAGRNPMKRAGRPEDIAYAAVWLASDESPFVTGQAIAIEGGVTSSIYWN